MQKQPEKQAAEEGKVVETEEEETEAEYAAEPRYIDYLEEEHEDWEGEEEEGEEEAH